jgi:hypothetical protein
MDNINKYYVYAHLKPGTDEVFYIGRGQKSRIIDKCINKRNDYWKRIVNKYGGFDYFKIEEGLTNDQANQLEMYWIAQFRNWGFNLVNMTDGGEGCVGKKLTKEQIEGIRLRALGNKRNVGRRCSEETKKKISQSNKGRSLTKEQRENLIKLHTGRKASDETKKKMSESHKGLNTWAKGSIRSEETKKKISESSKGKIPWCKGKKWTDEQKKNLIESRKKRIRNKNGQFI